MANVVAGHRLGGPGAADAEEAPRGVVTSGCGIAIVCLRCALVDSPQARGASAGEARVAGAGEGVHGICAGGLGRAIVCVGRARGPGAGCTVAGVPFIAGALEGAHRLRAARLGRAGVVDAAVRDVHALRAAHAHAG
eukprot:984853-Rhodomonas_salina.1